MTKSFRVGKEQDYLMESEWCEHTRISVRVEREGLRIGAPGEEALVEYEDVDALTELIAELMAEHRGERKDER